MNKYAVCFLTMLAGCEVGGLGSGPCWDRATDAGAPICFYHGEDCARDEQCAGKYCKDAAPGRLGKCDHAPCQDGKKNANETGVDCGGIACTPCGDGLRCLLNRDCQSGNCENGLCRPMAACSDRVRNGDETDVDCGGSCLLNCRDGMSCLQARDCVSDNCMDGICRPRPNCNDKIKNGDESDVDCGGPDCPGCQEKKRCRLGSDCESKSCQRMVYDGGEEKVGVCVKNTCSDKIWNGEESDEDCGYRCPNRCADGARCFFDSDCASKRCASLDGGVPDGGRRMGTCLGAP